MFNEKRSSMLHGVLLIALFSCAAFYIGEMSFVRSISFSPMIVGIILGMLYANSLRNHLPETWVPGIQFCSKKILRIGIILYGFRLTFQDVMAIGLPAMLIDVIIVAVTICGGIYLGKLLKMDRGIALLTSIGSGICGAAAILGAESTIKAKPYKTAVSVSTVVIFGTISMFLYPFLYRNGFCALTPDQMGIYTGTMTSAGRLMAVILHISQTMSLDLITCVTIWLSTRSSLFREVSTMLSSMRSIQCLSMRHVHRLSFQDRVASRQDFTRHAISWLRR